MHDPSRPRAFRIGRSAFRWFWAGLAGTVPALVLFVIVRAVAGSSASRTVTAALTVLLVLGLIWGIVAFIVGVTQKATYVDPDAQQISLRGGPWIPVSALAYGTTAWVSGGHAISIGTHKGDAVWISETLLVGDSAEVRRWAHWLVQSSSVSGTTREDLLRVTSGWAR